MPMWGTGLTENALIVFRRTRQEENLKERILRTRNGPRRMDRTSEKGREGYEHTEKKNNDCGFHFPLFSYDDIYICHEISYDIR